MLLIRGKPNNCTRGADDRQIKSANADIPDLKQSSKSSLAYKT